MNESMTIDDMVSALPRRFYGRLRLLSGLGPFADGLNEIGSSVGILAAEFLYHPSTLLIGAMLGAYWLGVGFGGFIIGWVSDVFGRRTVFVMDALFMGILALWSAFTFTETTYFIARWLLGFIIGGDYSVALPLVSEYSPKKDRGRSLSFISLLFMIGITAGSALSVSLEVTIGLVLASRVFFIISSIPAFILFILRIDMPESLRWAIANGRKDIVSKILDFFKKRQKKGSYEFNEDLFTKFVSNNAEYGSRNTFSLAIKNFFNRANLYPILYILFLASMYSFGVNYLGIYGPVLFTRLGATTTESLMISTIGFTGGLIGVIIPVLWVDKIGRVKTAVYGFIFSAIILSVYLILVITHKLTLTDMFIIDPLFLFVILGLVRTMAWVPSSEFGGTKSRGISQGWTKLWEFPTAFPAFILYGMLGVLYAGIFALVSLVLGIILVTIFGVETKNKSLEKISEEEKSGVYNVK